ncbi:hypothetical protein [Desulfogranum mediterraneum]|uniref:hypothetical protein n=1 Tax=Desulfogranum mediterraneum TaxID=160661 RepID=UPI0003FA49AA|nr:hypothetical protein [Desulfogranum mediterraneum]
MSDPSQQSPDSQDVPKNTDTPEISSKILPVMREAIIMVQMVLFQRLQADIAGRYPEWSPERQRTLAGAVVNNLFGSEPTDPEVTLFGREHRQLVEEELRGLAVRLESLCPYLTDALRMKTICDNQEGFHSIPSLLMAQALGILHQDRALPMPSTFMLSVRSLAAESGLVKQFKAAPPPEE